MPRYHLNLRHGSYLFADEHGADFGDLAAARDSASRAARDLIAEHPVDQDWSTCRFEITDRAGSLVAALDFAPVRRALAAISDRPRHPAALQPAAV